MEESKGSICGVYLVPSFGKVELALDVVEDISFSSCLSYPQRDGSRNPLTA
jgi:hypothetical protein